jgi:hypothetical protein
MSRPEILDAVMEFVGDPEATEIMRYIEQLEHLLRVMIVNIAEPYAVETALGYDAAVRTIVGEPLWIPLIEKVKRAISNAKENGYTFEGWTVPEIAADIQRCDSDLEDPAIEQGVLAAVKLMRDAGLV